MWVLALHADLAGEELLHEGFLLLLGLDQVARLLDHLGGKLITII